MFLVGKCLKCGAKVKLDIKDHDKAWALETVKGMDGYMCPGHHVELGSPYPTHWNIDTWVLEEGNPMDDEQFLEYLRSQCSEVRNTEEMAGLMSPGQDNRGGITGYSMVIRSRMTVKTGVIASLRLVKDGITDE